MPRTVVRRANQVIGSRSGFRRAASRGGHPPGSLRATPGGSADGGADADTDTAVNVLLKVGLAASLR
jgi:hypothetical protein